MNRLFKIQRKHFDSQITVRLSAKGKNSSLDRSCIYKPNSNDDNDTFPEAGTTPADIDPGQIFPEPTPDPPPPDKTTVQIMDINGGTITVQTTRPDNPTLDNALMQSLSQRWGMSIQELRSTFSLQAYRQINGF